jgi:hypothetical protein
MLNLPPLQSFGPHGSLYSSAQSCTLIDIPTLYRLCLLHKKEYSYLFFNIHRTSPSFVNLILPLIKDWNAVTHGL